MADGETYLGQLDMEASRALEELLVKAQVLGADIDAGQMMSRAIRLYHNVVNGHVDISPSPELEAHMASAEAAGAGVRH